MSILTWVLDLAEWVCPYPESIHLSRAIDAYAEGLLRRLQAIKEDNNRPPSTPNNHV